jgi:hypothetical protein
MSTRWQIAAKLSDGRCGCIYVHHGGYPEYALELLTKHYTDQAKIDALIALGDCSFVGSTLEDCGPYVRKGESWENVCPTYGSDVRAVANKHEHGDEEYRYLWDGVTWTMAKL